MKHHLPMNFNVDKDNKKILVEREFAAGLSTVWAAWTTQELLDQWWAPKPWKAKTKKMDFREGGTWLYAMVGPQGEEHWALAEYLSIRKEQGFSGLDAFCDPNGKIDTSLPRSRWDVQFAKSGDHTKVTINISYDKLEDLEKTIEMGFREGFTAGMENLDELLARK